MRADKAGREVFLSFEANVGHAVHEACAFNDFTDGMCVARAASILRRDMFNEFPKFSGSLSDGFGSRDCVPPSLLNFVATLLGGYNIDKGSPASSPEQTAAYSIAQLIRFNSVKRERLNRLQHTRHHVSHETPLPIYIGLMVHNCSLKKSVVEKMNHLGLCISYDRVQQIEATVTNVLCDSYRSSGAVVPLTLSTDIFTTAAIDNIDHNTSSSTATESFHGSSVTVIQHPEVCAPVPTLQLEDMAWSRTVCSTLPDTYTCVPETGNVTYDIPIASINTCLSASDAKPLEQLFPWLNVVESAVCGETHCVNSSFAAYHSTTAAEEQTEPILCNNTLLPLLPDRIQSPATTRHLMNIVIHITNTINKQQPAVITADQPVYAVAKALQWKYPDLYGEDRIVMMMGGLHIEMAIQNIIGKWLAGSGWTDIFLKAGVATAGRCESLLRSSHVKRTRYAHEVSVAALYVLRNEAYLADVNDTPESLESWVSRRCADSAQFLYWETAMELEALLLGFVRSIRESSFALYIQMLKEICPWFFALDLTHYSRWLPVFIKTLEELPVRHPEVYEAFRKGHFTSRKTASNFSAVSDDQLHEQNNKVIKGDGGAVGMFGNETALLKWMVGGPEIARMVHEFEFTVDSSSESHTESHHEVSKNFQSRYIGHVSKVVQTLQVDGNPFMEKELQTADCQKIILTATAEKSVIEAKAKGMEKYEEFVEDRLICGRKPLSAPIQRTNLELFSVPKLHQNSNKLKITDLRHDSNTFCKLYVASQSRAGNVDDFFAHENNQYPPSVSERKAT